MLTEQELQDRLKQINHVRPLILSASYKNGLMTLALGGGAAPGTVVTFNPRVMPWLADLPDSAFEDLRIFPDGAAVGLPAVNLDVPWNGVVKHVLGIETAEAFRARIQSASTPKKAASSRANGAKGGRPRKNLIETLRLPKEENLGDALDG